MANRALIEKFLEVTATAKGYDMAIVQIFKQMRENLDLDGADDLELSVFEDILAEMKASLINHVVESTSQLFSDEEMVEIIEAYSQPAMQRLVLLTPEISAKTSEYALSIFQETEAKVMERMLAQKTSCLKDASATNH